MMKAVSSTSKTHATTETTGTGEETTTQEYLVDPHQHIKRGQILEDPAPPIAQVSEELELPFPLKNLSEPLGGDMSILACPHDISNHQTDHLYEEMGWV